MFCFISKYQHRNTILLILLFFLLTGNINILNAQYDPILDAIPEIDTCYIPTDDGKDEAIHPDVLYFKNGFETFDTLIYFFMVMTPYHNFNASIENPSMVYSLDGVIWDTLNSNPLVPQPTTGHNDDPDIFWDQDSDSFNIYYLETHPHTKQYLMLLQDNSTIQDSIPDTIITYDPIGTNPNDDIFIVSPSIVNFNDTFFLFYVHLIEYTSDKKDNGDKVWDSSYVEFIKSPDPDKWEDYEKDTTQANFVNWNTRYRPWHINVFNGSDGYYYMLCNAYDSSDFWLDHNLFIGRSSDLLNWYFKYDPIITEYDEFFLENCRGVYRSSGLINKDMDLLVVWFSWFSENITKTTNTHIGVAKFNWSDIFGDSVEIIYVPDDFSTIQSAIDNANHGDTILVSPGTYTLTEPIRFKGKNVIVKSSDGPHVTTITANSNIDLVIFDSLETSAAVLEGFTLEGGRIAVWCKNAWPIIRNNIIRDQNIFNWAAIDLSGEGWASEGNSPATIINNTIVNSTNGGISTFSTEEPTIKNNIIINCTYGIHCHSMGNVVEPELDFNNVWDCTVNYVNCSDSGTHSISEDPIFTTHYSLYGGSPCIDAGDSCYFYDDPDQTRNDIGAVPTYQVNSEFTYNNIQMALDSVEKHDVILVHPDSYILSKPLDYKGKDIILMSYDFNNRAEITSNIDTMDLAVFDEGETNYAELRNFTLQGGRMAIWCKNSSPTIIGNLIVDQNISNWAAIALSGEQWASPGSSPARIINNTIVNSDNGAISTFSDSSPDIRNNIIINCTYGIHRQSIFLPLSNDYNDVWNNNTNYINCTAGDSSICTDPLLNLNFELTKSSPCIDKGDHDSIYNDPDDSRNDMGWKPYQERFYNFSVDDNTYKLNLSQNFPNPFRTSTTISFSISEPSEIEISIYNIAGRKVCTLLRGFYNQGEYSINWNGTDSQNEIVVSGFYVYELKIGDTSITNKLLFIK